MTLIYQIMNLLLPFEWAQHTFMKNALLGVLLVTPVFAILGTMIVNNKMAFFSDALGHSALTGVAIGFILGFHSPLGSMLVFSILLALAITSVKKANTTSTDTIIGVFSSTAVALGIVLLSAKGGFSKYSVYLIGDILSISSFDLGILAVVLVLVSVFWIISFNKLFLISTNKSLASSRGIKVQFYEYLFTIIIAIVVTIAIQWVGILIISSLIILPAAAARNIAQNMRQYHIYSVIIAVISGIAGLILSYIWATASGATIVLAASTFFAITFMLKFRLKG